ncbi:MAG: DUF371 domain-containing protein [Candidatus Lokiarchaeota archaeon]|nr:DUF371 domain-containing protein [Candidatus Lokiarchaeota archaeon]
MAILEKVSAYGHENILCTHSTTIEITKEKSVTKKGNCIIGINASKACFDLNRNLKKKIKDGNKIKITLKLENLQDSFFGFGNKELRLLDKNDMVFRKSNFICDRTVLINCTKSSNEINREIIEKLKMPGKELSIIFEINERNGNQ